MDLPNTVIPNKYQHPPYMGIYDVIMKHALEKSEYTQNIGKI